MSGRPPGSSTACGLDAVPPVRVRLSRARGWRMPPGTVKVDRTTRWGNPFVPGRPAPFGAERGRMVVDSDDAYELYRRHALQDKALQTEARLLLRGKNLACWCRQGDTAEDRCHAAVLLLLANDPAAELPEPEREHLWNR